jgi:hypothetical protein
MHGSVCHIHFNQLSIDLASCPYHLSKFLLRSRRVSELEQENARLLVLAQNRSLPAPQQAQSDKSDNELVSEVEQLKAELAAAKERERTLSAQLATKSVTCDAPIKVEATEPDFSFSSPARPSATLPHKSGASLGLMVS